MSTPGPPMTVWVSIGNRDDKLTARGWVKFHGEIVEMLTLSGASFQGEWFSSPLAPWQTACWCVDIQPGIAERLKGELGAIGAAYGRGMVAWSEVSTAVYLG